jgi:hypothetical protein
MTDLLAYPSEAEAESRGDLVLLRALVSGPFRNSREP